MLSQGSYSTGRCLFELAVVVLCCCPLDVSDWVKHSIFVHICANNNLDGCTMTRKEDIYGPLPTGYLSRHGDVVGVYFCLLWLAQFIAGLLKLGL